MKKLMLCVVFLTVASIIATAQQVEIFRDSMTERVLNGPLLENHPPSETGLRWDKSLDTCPDACVP